MSDNQHYLNCIIHKKLLLCVIAGLTRNPLLIKRLRVKPAMTCSIKSLMNNAG